MEAIGSTGMSSPTGISDLLPVERLVVEVWKRQRTGDLITVREAADILGFTQERVLDLAEEADLMVNIALASPTGLVEIEDAGDYTLEDLMIDPVYLEELAG